MENIHKYRGMVQGERRIRTKDEATGRYVEKIEEIEAEVWVTVDLAGILSDLGRAAIQNQGGKSGALRGSVKARVVSEKVVSSREKAWV